VDIGVTNSIVRRPRATTETSQGRLLTHSVSRQRKEKKSFEEGTGMSTPSSLGGGKLRGERKFLDLSLLPSSTSFNLASQEIRAQGSNTPDRYWRVEARSDRVGGRRNDYFPFVVSWR